MHCGGKTQRVQWSVFRVLGPLGLVTGRVRGGEGSEVGFWANATRSEDHTMVIVTLNLHGVSIGHFFSFSY
jgi:hypothetical protein